MILVTGGTGMVGAHLLFDLISKGKKVRAIYRNSSNFSGVKNVFKENNLDFNKIEWFEADLNNVPKLLGAFERVTHVYHCAAKISFDSKDDKELIKSNINGTANIVNLSLDANVSKLIYISSIATFSEEKDGMISEISYWNQEADNNMYAITKYGAETEVWRGTQEGLNAIIVNPGFILGAHFWNTGSGTIFKKIKNGFRYFTDGSVGLVSVTDVSKIVIELMASKIENQQYILVAENWSYKNLVETIVFKLGLKREIKKIKPFSLKVAYCIDYLKSHLLSKNRNLFKANIKSAFKNLEYDNSKIKSEGFVFESTEATIEKIAKLI